MSRESQTKISKYQPVKKSSLKISKPHSSRVMREQSKHSSGSKSIVNDGSSRRPSIVHPDPGPVLPWPEWSDAELNNERWDGRGKELKRRSVHDLEVPVFTERTPVQLPASLRVDKWQRINDVFAKSANPPILYLNTNKLVDFSSTNKDVMGSEIMNWIVTDIIALWHLGSTHVFPIEGETSNFHSNTKHLNWMPWHHIYSVCKAGKGVTHAPVINVCGKYIVRLYFMGYWRRIIVDDQVPIDDEGHLLLPSTAVKHEIWPYVLTKALLKVAELTWRQDKEVVDFSAISCLTGWAVQGFSVKYLTADKLWEKLEGFLKKYESVHQSIEAEMDVLKQDADSSLENLSRTSSDPASTQMMESKQRFESVFSIKTKGSKLLSPRMGSVTSPGFKNHSRILKEKASRMKEKRSMISGQYELSDIDSSNIWMGGLGKQENSSEIKHGSFREKPLLGIEDKQELSQPVVYGVVPRQHLHDPELEAGMTRPLLLLQTRVTPFLYQKPRPDAPLPWKKYRWIKWATELGIWSPETCLPHRYLQLLSLFNEEFDQIDDLGHDMLPKTCHYESRQASGDLINLSQSQNVNNDNKISTSNNKQFVDGTKSYKSQTPSTVHGISLSKITLENKKSSLSSKNEMSNPIPSKLLLINRNVDNLKANLGEDSMKKKTNNVVGLIWTDFNHMPSKVEKVLVFFKPSDYFYSFKISNLTSNEVPVPTNRGQNHGTPSSEKLRELAQNVTFPYNIHKSNNDCTFMLIDSSDDIQCLFVLHTFCRDGFRMNFGNNGYSSSSRSTSVANVIIEQFDWTEGVIGEPVVVVESAGVNSTTLTLGPGRHIFRLWIKTDSAVILHALSNNPMIFGTRGKIRDAMKYDSIRMKHFVQQMRARLSMLLASFGKPNFTSVLHSLFQGLNLFSTKSKNCSQIHHAFKEATVRVLKSIVGQDPNSRNLVFALKVIFVDTHLGSEKRFSSASHLADFERLISIGNVSVGFSTEEHTLFYDNSDETDVTSRISWLTKTLQNVMSKAANRIQAAWRGYCVRKLVNLHSDTTSKLHKTVQAHLKKVSDLLLSPNKCSDVLTRVLREMFNLEPHIIPLIPLYSDLKQVVKVDEYQGLMVSILPNTWIPVVRMVVTCHSETPVICAVSGSCHFPMYMVRVVDNDTMAELPRTVFNVEPTMLKKNCEGYTIIMYGWNETQQKENFWKLRITTMKNLPPIHPCTIDHNTNQCVISKPPTLMTMEVSNYYITNKEYLICRLLVRVKQKLVVTFRLTVSYNAVKLRLRLLREDGFLLSELQGMDGAVIIPAALLDSGRGVFGSLYVLEAFVIDKSWPLTRTEWRVQERLRNQNLIRKERNVIYKSMYGGLTPASKKIDTALLSPKFKLKKKEVSGDIFEKPYWTLQAVVDASISDPLTIVQDRRREQRNAAMKAEWEKFDPGRGRRAENTRHVYLKDVYGMVPSTVSIFNRPLDTVFGRITNSRETLFEQDTGERFIHPPEDFAVAKNRSHYDKFVSNYIKASDDGRKVKTESDEENESMERIAREEKFQEDREALRLEGIQRFKDLQELHQKMYSHYSSHRFMSQQLMESAYNARDTFVYREKIKARLKRHSTKIKDSIKKKKKKKKKSKSKGGSVTKSGKSTPKSKKGKVSPNVKTKKK